METMIELIFTQFARLGTINGVLQYLVRHQLQLPHRLRTGLAKGELQGRIPIFRVGGVVARWRRDIKSQIVDTPGSPSH